LGPAAQDRLVTGLMGKAAADAGIRTRFTTPSTCQNQIIRPSRPPAAQVNGPPPPTWTAEDGNARSTVEVVAEELGPSLRWATATTTRATRSQGESPALRTSHRPGRGPRDGPGGLVSVVATSHQVHGTQGPAPPAAPPTRRQGNGRRTCHRRCIASPRSLRPQNHLHRSWNATLVQVQPRRGRSPSKRL
jgi:hypothetical protein